MVTRKAVERPKLKDPVGRAHAFGVASLIKVAVAAVASAKAAAYQGDLPASVIGTLEFARDQLTTAENMVVDQLVTYVPGEKTDG